MAVTLKIVVICMIVLFALLVIGAMVLVVKYGNKSRKDKQLFRTMEDHSDSQDRLISLLKSSHDANKFEQHKIH